MTRDDIIAMAREAGKTKWFGTHPDGTSDFLGAEFSPEQLERFAALVAAAEREKVARWQIGSGYSTGHGETIEDLLVELEWQVRESEREACAKVCDVVIPGDEYSTALINSYADDIRARGETK